jgi:hypothetical protein
MTFDVLGDVLQGLTTSAPQPHVSAANTCSSYWPRMKEYFIYVPRTMEGLQPGGLDLRVREQLSDPS